jgi:hypothetical protein
MRLSRGLSILKSQPTLRRASDRNDRGFALASRLDICLASGSAGVLPGANPPTQRERASVCCSAFLTCWRARAASCRNMESLLDL